MENEENIYNDYEPENRPKGRHLAPKVTKNTEVDEEYDQEEVPAPRPRPKKKRKSRKKSRKEQTNWIMIAAMCALAVLILCLIFFLPKRNVVKTPAPTPVVTSQPDNGDLVIGQENKAGGEGQQEADDNSEAQQAVQMPVETPKPAAKVNWKAGDTVKLGSYKQDKAGNAAPLEWKVVKRDGDYALLVCKNIVKFMKMHDTTESNWDESFIRDWLNNSERGYGALYKKGTSFMGTAFTAEEQSALIALCDAPASEVKLQDKVFILSLAEANEFSSMLAKGCYPTEYAVLEGQRIGLGTLQEGTTRWWWLRTTDGSQHFRFINDAGEVGEKSKDADNDYGGIRPAVWVDLTKVPA